MFESTESESDDIFTFTASGQVLALWPVLRQTLHSRKLVLPRFDDTPCAPSSHLSCSTIPFSTKSWLACSLVRAPESCNRVLLALRRFERASLASRSALTSLVRSVSWWPLVTTAFANWSTEARIDVGELPWCRATRPLIRADCEMGFCSSVWRLGHPRLRQALRGPPRCWRPQLNI